MAPPGGDGDNGAMDRWTLPFAVAAALWAQGHPEPAGDLPPTAADNAWLAAHAPAPAPKPRPAPAVSAAAFDCLAQNVYHEARGVSKRTFSAPSVSKRLLFGM